MSETLFSSLTQLLYSAANMSSFARQELLRADGDNVIGWLDGLDRVLSIAIQVGSLF